MHHEDAMVELRGDAGCDLRRNALGADMRAGGPFDAAVAICNADAEIGMDTLDALDALVEHSLVRRVETDQGTTRFRMLNTIHEFSAEMLSASGDMATLQRRHAEYVLSLVEEAAPRVTRDPVANQIPELEHGNVRAALAWSMKNGETEIGLRLASGLWRYWMLNSHLAEGRRWLTDLLALPRASERTAQRAPALTALGSITYWQNDFDATRRHYRESLEVFRQVGDRSGTIEALYNVGFPALLEAQRVPRGAGLDRPDSGRGAAAIPMRRRPAS
ncbi:MAG: hypothetical protein ABR529_07865 [Actinomycetota bacterium]